jgi:hypothetical protein
VQQRQHRRQGVLGEELLPSQHHDQETDRVAERSHQPSGGLVGNQRVKLALDNQGQSHRKAGGEAGQHDGPPSPFQFLLTLGADCLMDQRCARPALGFDLFRLAPRDAVEL